MATLHLIHGFVGVGKTAFAKKLELENNIIRFSVDEWMITLFGTNPPKSYFERYLDSMKYLIWLEAKKFLELGYDVILDFGFWKRSERDYYRTLAQEIKVQVKLYTIQCAAHAMVKRVLAVPLAIPPDAFYIDKQALDEFKLFFEALDPLTEESIRINTDETE